MLRGLYALSAPRHALRPLWARGLSSSSTPLSLSDGVYLFDLNGFLVLRGVFPPEQVAAANAAIEKRLPDMKERLAPELRNTKRGSPLAGDESRGRKDLGQVLEWGLDSEVFRRVLDHPRLVPMFHSLLGKGYRMDHSPFVIAQDKGAEGFALHGGTVDCRSGAYNPHLAYNFSHGTIRNALLAVSVVLSDHPPGAGGFCVVPGSHKSNFRTPESMCEGEAFQVPLVR